LRRDLPGLLTASSYRDVAVFAKVFQTKVEGQDAGLSSNLPKLISYLALFSALACKLDKF
jgi:hypothetical protein